MKPKREASSGKPGTGYTRHGHASSGNLKDSYKRAGPHVRVFGKRVNKQERRVGKERSRLDKLYRDKALIPRNASPRIKNRMAKQIRKEEQKLDRESVKLDQLQQQTGAVVGHFDAATDELT